MGDYINRANVIAKFQKTIDNLSKGEYLDGVRRALEIVEGEPAADVRYDIHSRWYRNKIKGTITCENCEKYNIVESQYCPHCGAKMEREQR